MAEEEKKLSHTGMTCILVIMMRIGEIKRSKDQKIKRSKDQEIKRSKDYDEW